MVSTGVTNREITFEHHVRVACVVGLVGAGGIGGFVARALAARDLAGVLVLLTAVLVMVLALDAVTSALRRRWLPRARRSAD